MSNGNSIIRLFDYSIIRKAARGFTIVELLIVVGIISILMTLVFSAVTGSLADARARRADALCQAVQSGLAAYHAQYDEWPAPLGGMAREGRFGGSNEEGVDNTNDPEKYVLKPDEVRKMVKALVDEAKKGNPLMDISGLFVSRDSGEAGRKGYGLDFIGAVRGTSRSHRKMSTSEMYFGYPDAGTGYFRRFKMVYSIPGDSLVVSAQ